MRYYPLYLDLQHQPVLVIGGGAVALQKISVLTACGARVHLVAPEAHPALKRLVQRRKIRWAKRTFLPSDIDRSKYRLVIAATHDETLNARAAALAREKQIWINVVDRPALCDFIAPAIAVLGPITVAISTAGASPALAKFLRKKVEFSLGTETATLAGLLKEFRPVLKKLPKLRKNAIVTQLVSDSFLSFIRRRGAAAARQKIQQALQKT